jgi:hypothetical protein
MFIRIVVTFIVLIVSQNVFALDQLGLVVTEGVNENLVVTVMRVSE